MSLPIPNISLPIPSAALALFEAKARKLGLSLRDYLEKASEQSKGLPLDVLIAETLLEAVDGAEQTG